MNRFKTLMLVWLMLVTLTAPAEASIFSDALAKARSAMQSAFQLSFLHKLPVVFYKQSFDKMFEHTNRSIDEMNLKYGERTITRDQFQNDKALHIKKSAELALRINHVGARAVFGEKKFNESLNKHLGTLIKPEGTPTQNSEPASAAVFGGDKAAMAEPVVQQVNPFSSEGTNIGGSSAARQQLIKRYYEASENGDSAAMKAISAELNAKP
jgi:hypothetical protein